jgi:hypothetical protein
MNAGNMQSRPLAEDSRFPSAAFCSGTVDQPLFLIETDRTRRYARALRNFANCNCRHYASTYFPLTSNLLELRQ